jgi:hypothetical protein
MSPPTPCPMRFASCFVTRAWWGGASALRTWCFGREVIEVATFRAASAPLPSEEPVPQADPEDGEAPELDEESELDDEAEFKGIDHERVLDTHGRLLRDNVYGSIDEDVWRRDFTVNSLYYNIADFSLVGLCRRRRGHRGARRLRLIGDPETRYREDPVRMLRAARFEAKLGFTLEPSTTAAPIARAAWLAGRGAGGAACSMRRSSCFWPVTASAVWKCCGSAAARGAVSGGGALSRQAPRWPGRAAAAPGI